MTRSERQQNRSAWIQARRRWAGKHRPRSLSRRPWVDLLENRRLLSGPDFTEYPIYSLIGTPGISDLVTGPDGNIWFTVPNRFDPYTGDSGPGNFIGELTTKDTVTTADLVTSGVMTLPSGTVIPAGTTVPAGMDIPAGTVAEFPIPTPNSEPAHIVAGPDGNLWFTEYNGNNIGEISGSNTLQDGTFNSSDWSFMTSIYAPGDTVAVTPSQQTSGGNPGDYQQIEFDATSVPNLADLGEFAFYTADSYDPSKSGAITSIDFSLNYLSQYPAQDDAGGTTYSMALMQNGLVYESYAGVYAVDGNLPNHTWLSWSHQMDAYSFELANYLTPCSTCALYPDFSSTGAPITFGYIASDGACSDCASGPGVVDAGVDNWKVTIHSALSVTSNVQITEYPLPEADSDNVYFGSRPVGITVGPASLTNPNGQQDLWFTMSSVNGIDTFQDYLQGYYLIDPLAGGGYVLPSVSSPEEIKTSLDGKSLWFNLKDAGAGLGLVGENTLAQLTSQGFIDETAPQAGSWTDFTVGPDGNIWGVGVGEIDRVTPGTSLTPLPSYSNAFVTIASVTSFYPGVILEGGITTGNDGNLWFTDTAGSIGRITPDGTITLYSSPTPGAGGSITVGPDGNIWFVDEPYYIDEMTYPPTTYIVTRDDDAMIPGTNLPVPGTLRYAIEHSNMIPGPNTITFDIPGSGPQVITLQSPLPAITTPVTIDGTTQPGYSSGSPVIVLNGAGAGPGADGLDLSATAAGSTIRGLEITAFQGAGLSFSGGSGFRVSGDEILNDGNPGIHLTGTSGSTIGGTTAGDRNIIAGNGDGILLSFGSTDDVIAGNYVGVAADGATALPNTIQGIVIEDSPGNTIGGTSAGDRNVISGNTYNGIILIGSGSTDDLVAGNFIGVTADGSNPLPNGSGIYVGAADFYVTAATGVADQDEILDNVISGNNNGYGIALQGDATNPTTGAIIQGNLIGTNAAGSAALPNTGGGIILYDVTASTIGGTASGAGNLISGNTAEGVRIASGSADNLVEGNLIGTNAAGSAAVGNGYSGISIRDGATGNTVGGTTVAARNVISAGGNWGVILFGTGTTGNLIEGNYIGTNAAGSAALGNAIAGVALGPPGNTVGGTVAGAGNLISGNGSTGIQIDGTGSAGCLVEGNLIGTDASGSVALGNGYAGVQISNGAVDNTIGGAIAAARNVLSGNGDWGVVIFGTGTSGNLVEGDFVGTNAAGTAAVPNAEGVGVYTPGNTIGGTAAGAGDVVSGNKSEGIRLDSGSGSTLVDGNFVGTNAAGSATVANGGDGIDIYGAGNAIGGTASGARNVVSGNKGLFGILLQGTSATGNLLEGNRIGTNAAGTAAVSNAYYGVGVNGPGNTIGGTAPGAGNLISGNGNAGIDFLTGGSTLVQGNFIGTNAAGSAAVPGGYVGMYLFSSGNTIGGTAAGAGNVISGNSSEGIYIYSMAGSELIQGNRIGTNAAGSAAVANDVGIQISGPNNTIGGTAAGAGNLISGNGLDGVWITGNAASSNLLEGNRMGTNAAGTAAIPNGDAVVIAAAGNTIGGTAAGAGNILSGNAGYGLRISGATAAGNVVQGNVIGTNAAGTAALGNGGDGVSIQGGASSNTIGGTAAGAGNVIAFNAGNGVAVGLGAFDAALENAILENSIFSNGALGIGVNNSAPQAAPVLISATDLGSQTTVTGTVSGAPNASCRIEFYSNPAGTGQGQTYLGFLNVTTNGSGSGAFSFSPPSSVSVGLNITATATDPNGDTSEFSAPATVQPAPVNVTSDLFIKLGGFVFNRSTRQFTQSITITNVSQAAITGPIELVLLNLTNATLVNQTGTYQGNPYITVLSSGSLGVGQSLTFTLVFNDPTLAPITYTSEFLAGPIPPED